MATSILQGLGGIGRDIGTGTEINREEKRAQLQDQLQKLQLQLQFREFQNRMQEQGFTQKLKSQPDVVQTYQGADGKMHSIVRDPMTGKLNDQGMGGEVADPVEMKAAALKRIGFTDDQIKMALGGESKTPVKPTEFDEWRSQFKSRTGRDPNDREIAQWHRQPREGSSGAGLGDSMLGALATKWTNEGIKPPGKYQAAVEQYMENKGMAAPDPRDAGIGRDAVKASAQARDSYAVYQTAQRLESAKDPKAHLALVFQAVRAMVAGAGRMTNVEIQQELKAGSFGDRIQRWYSQASQGLIPDEQVQQIMGVIKDNYDGKRQAAEQAWTYAYPDKAMPPWLKGSQPATAPAAVPAKADPVDDAIIKALGGK